MKSIIESIIGGMLILTPIDKNIDYNVQIDEVGQAKCLADNMYSVHHHYCEKGFVPFW